MGRAEKQCDVVTKGGSTAALPNLITTLDKYNAKNIPGTPSLLFLSTALSQKKEKKKRKDQRGGGRGVPLKTSRLKTSRQTKPKGQAAVGSAACGSEMNSAQKAEGHTASRYLLLFSLVLACLQRSARNLQRWQKYSYFVRRLKKL